MKQKAQMDVKGLFLTVVLAGVIAVIGLLIFSNVSRVSKDIYPRDSKSKTNESITISCSVGEDCDNSTRLAEKGYKTNTEVVRNATNAYPLVRNVDYKITLTGDSGELDTAANLTLINMTNSTQKTARGFNGTNIFVTYQFNAKSAAHTTGDKVDDTTLDSFELGVVSLIVLAATVILGITYYFVKV